MPVRIREWTILLACYLQNHKFLNLDDPVEDFSHRCGFVRIRRQTVIYHTEIFTSHNTIAIRSRVAQADMATSIDSNVLLCIVPGYKPVEFLGLFALTRTKKEAVHIFLRPLKQSRITSG